MRSYGFLKIQSYIFLFRQPGIAALSGESAGHGGLGGDASLGHKTFASASEQQGKDLRQLILTVTNPLRISTN